MALVVPVLTRGNELDSLTVTFTVSSLSTSHSCQARNLAASFSGGLGKLISTLYSGYLLCSIYRIIFPLTVYASGSVKQGSAGAMMRERIRAKWLRASGRSDQPAQTMTSEVEAMIAGTAMTRTVVATETMAAH